MFVFSILILTMACILYNILFISNTVRKIKTKNIEKVAFLLSIVAVSMGFYEKITKSPLELLAESAGAVYGDILLGDCIGAHNKIISLHGFTKLDTSLIESNPRIKAIHTKIFSEVAACENTG